VLKESALEIHVESLGAWLEPWRHATVEVANKGMPPHVTLLYPWRTAPLSEEDAGQVQKVLEHQPPFELRFSELSHFGKRLIYLALDEQSEQTVKRLMNVLFDAFPETPPYGGQFSDPTPHLTVAKAKDDEHFGQLMKEISERLEPELPVKHFVDKVSVVQQGSDGFWRLHSEVFLRSVN
jgi:2'-5' RNA ligase